ncbi:MAG: hypothetical protein GXY91_07405 [Clostridia bacterium]|nr:hypothetical protein [Clostridia bacterium]
MTTRITITHEGEPVKDFLEDLQKKVITHPLIKVYTNEQVANISGFI